MTRRAIVPQPLPGLPLIQCYNGEAWWKRNFGDDVSMSSHARCPYGEVGRRLWVRETFTSTKEGEPIYRADPIFDGMGPGDFAWSWRPSIFMPRRFSRILLEIVAIRAERLQGISEEDSRAEGVREFVDSEAANDPAWCAYSVRAAISQGRQRPSAADDIGAFAYLWDSINARRRLGWDVNPWVWVIGFKRILPASPSS